MGMLMAMTQAKLREEKKNLPEELPAPSAERVEQPVKEAEQPKRKTPVVRHTTGKRK